VGDVDGFVDLDNCEIIPRRLCVEYSTLARVSPGDILFTKGGAIDRVGFVTGEAAVSRDLIFLNTSKLQVFQSEFLFAYFSSEFFKRMLVRSSSQTTQSHLTITLVRELPILKASGRLQEAVAGMVTRALDAKLKQKGSLAEADSALLSAIGLGDWSPPEPLAYVRPLTYVKDTNRWDAQFHLPRVDGYLEKLAEHFRLCSIGSLGEVTNGEPVAYSEDGTVPIIRSGDLADIDDDVRFLRAGDGASFFKLERGDVLISSIGFGSIGKVQVFDKPGTFGTVSEVTVIRQTMLDPHFLAAFLRSKPGQVQIERWVTGATGQLHLYPRDVRRIMVPLAEEELQKSMRAAAERMRETRRKAAEFLDIAKRAVEIAIEQDELAALRFLDAAEA
jgi:restriction endonuclease S subunit